MSREDSGEPRRLKYRMSCDICYAAKIKCGSTKAPCRRCSIKNLDCVFSVSHRKGRPREKKKSLNDVSPGTTGTSEPTQLPNSLALSAINPDVQVMDEPNDSGGILAPTSSLIFDSTFDPFTVGDDFDFEAMLTPLEKTTSLESREENPEASAYQVERSEVLVRRDSSQENPLHALTFQSDRFLQSGLSPILDSMPAMNWGFSDDFDMPDAINEQHSEKSSTIHSANNSISYDDLPSLARNSVQHISSRTTCDCFSELLRRIRILESQQKSREFVPLGSVLVMERESHEGLCRLQRCQRCSEDTMAYLFATVSARIVLNLMQKTVYAEFMTRNGGASRSISRRGTTGPMEQSPEPVRSRDQHESNLYIGTYPVASKARRRFLRDMLQTRFSGFLAQVEEREKLVSGLGRDCFTESASAMMASIARDLRTVLGRMELWSSRD